LPLLLSAGTIANVAATATAAPVPSAVIAATAAYFSAAVTTASMFQRFRLPLCFNISDCLYVSTFPPPRPPLPLFRSPSPP
jgi:hypothetical protein